MKKEYADAKSRRKMGGIKARAFGNMFEELFYMNCRRLNIGVTQIPDSCKQISRTKIIRVKSPFDWILTHEGRSAFIDTKTTMDNFGKSDISDHQVKELLIHEKAGGIAGYVIWFRDKDLIILASASVLEAHKRNGKLALNENHPEVKALGTSVNFQLLRIFGETQSLCRKCGKPTPEGRWYCTRECAPYGNINGEVNVRGQ